MQNDNVEGRKAEAKIVARRFVRSVARIFVVISIEMSPDANRKKRYVFCSTPTYPYIYQQKYLDKRFIIQNAKIWLNIVFQFFIPKQPIYNTDKETTKISNYLHYRSTSGLEPFHTDFRGWIMVIIENLTVTEM